VKATKTGLALAVVENREDLTDLERRFLIEYETPGECFHNGTRAWMKASGAANYNTASIEASEALRKPSAQRFREELRAAAIGQIADRLTPWVRLAGEAQQVLLATMRGERRSRLELDAAREVLAYAIGRPKETHELQVADQENARGALKLLKARMRDEQRTREAG
jgi:hypothetical protein